MTQTTVRPHRVLRTVLVVLLVATAGAVAVGAIAWCSVFGCTLFSEDFEPQGEEATRARAAAVSRVADLADRASADGRVIARATRDGCRTGQNDWKRKDTYSHECEVDASRLVVVATERSAVADGLTAVDIRLRGLGCEPRPRGGLDRVRDEYWDEGNPNVAREGAAGLPSATYACGEDRSVEVEPLSARGSTSSLRSLTNGTLWLDDALAVDWYDVDDVRALRESDAELALVVTVGEGYYRTRF
ncbi:hypothetical protein [Oryzobacter terrae]|uniref:hypothetical protein n=1 Tax=Oryzobacter terrae TaxID=1620385 RepID=UPI00366C5FE9